MRTAARVLAARVLAGLIVAGLVVLGPVVGGSREEPGGENAAVETRRGTAAGRPGEPDVSVATEQRRTHLVTYVADGDTIRLGSGETVRLVGVDAPERGACGSVRAVEGLRRLVLGKRVRLGTPGEDRDRYGRLLRYVDVRDEDAALRLIEQGLAVARYDSRDGYGRHPRQRTYVEADEASREVTCPTSTTVGVVGGGAIQPPRGSS